MHPPGRHGIRNAATVAAALCLSGCLFNGAPAPRYFAPPSQYLFADDPPAQPAAPAIRPIRLRRVHAAAYLGEQIVWRVSDVERGLYEQRRWTEFPSRYVQRALDQALDRTGAVRRVDTGRVPTLDVELVSFDEVLAPQHEAAVAAFASFRATDNAAVFERLFASRQPITDAAPASAARAMGAALDAVVVQIADQVAASVRTLPPAQH
jgi:ABC-type uncharacterized transport system auxiliary subunit